MIFQIGEKIMNYSGTVSTEKSGTIRPKYPTDMQHLFCAPYERIKNGLLIISRLR